MPWHKVDLNDASLHRTAAMVGRNPGLNGNVCKLVQSITVVQHCTILFTSAGPFGSLSFITWYWTYLSHYYDIIMSAAMASQITGMPIVCSGVDQRIHPSSVSLAFVRGNHLWPVDSPHKRPVKITWKIFPFDDVILWLQRKNTQSILQTDKQLFWKIVLKRQEVFF